MTDRIMLRAYADTHTIAFRTVSARMKPHQRFLICYLQRFSWDDPVYYHVFADGYCAEREKMSGQEIKDAEARHGKLLFMTEKC